ncbi:MAG: ArsR family transcriptional regulator [Flavobacteriaceae bacterium]
MLGELITSKTRLRLVIKFFVSQANQGYLNGLATEMGESTNAIRKELNHLHQAGYLQKQKENNKVHYQANTQHPLFEVMQKVVMKHLGIEDIVETVVSKIGNIQKIVLIGSYAEGIDSGHIEVFLIGDELNTTYIQNLEQKIENTIGRKVSFYLSPTFSPTQKHIILYATEKSPE